MTVTTISRTTAGLKPVYNKPVERTPRIIDFASQPPGYRHSCPTPNPQPDPWGKNLQVIDYTSPPPVMDTYVPFHLESG